MRLNQRGFTGLEIILVIVALSAIGAAGYFAWQSKSVPTQTEVKAPAKKASTPTKHEKELALKEISLKLKLTSEIEDITYVVQEKDLSTTNGDGAPYTVSAIGFSTTTLTSAGKGTKLGDEIADCSAAGSPIGTIEKYSVDPSNLGLPYAQGIKKIGSFYYAISYPDGSEACSSDQKVIDLSNKQRKALRQAYDKAQELK